MKKICIRCKVCKPLEEYYTRRSGREETRCKACVREDSTNRHRARGGKPKQIIIDNDLKIKRCSSCETWRPFELFHNAGNGDSRLRSHCIYCMRARQYGVSHTQMEMMLTTQHCQGCGRHRDDTKLQRLVVDHDHNTGRVRGMLCDACNVTLGQFDDNADFLNGLLRYLNAHKQ